MFFSWLHIFPAPRVSEPRLADTTSGWLTHPTQPRWVDISAVLCEDDVFVAVQSLGRVPDPEAPVRFSIFRKARRRPF